MKPTDTSASTPLIPDADTQVERVMVPGQLAAAEVWPRLAQQVCAWADAHGLSLRDVCWLLPFSALLPQARRALAARGGWQPRVETTQTLAQQLAPHRGAGQGVFGGDTVTSRLQAAHLLRQQEWGKAWARSDPRAFTHGVAALVDTAEALCAAASVIAPGRRQAWWQDARAHLALAAGPGEMERALARIALEWVAASLDARPPDTDALYQAPGSGWVVLRAGGADLLAEAVMAHHAQTGVAGLLLDLDGEPGHEFEAAARGAPPALMPCADAEDEARAATALVLAALDAGGTVALVAQDRETVRRVHALLARLQVPVVDDTGWRVATTRAGAQAMAVLRAARSLGGGSAAEDARLDWLKDDMLGRAAPEALVALEALWRGRRISDDAESKAKALWAVAECRLASLVAERSRPLADWLQCLTGLWLADADEAQRWRDDAAGRAVLLALRLDTGAGLSAAWQAAASSTRFTLDEFIAWVDEALEEASVVPDNPPEARVVITPLARVMLRPFSAVVCPGADERRLGVSEPHPDLLGPALSAALGLPGPRERLRRDTLAFVHLLRQPQVSLLYRVADGAEGMGPSPLIQRLVLARAEARVQPPALPVLSVDLPQRTVPSQPVHAPMPQAGMHWPPSLSASAVEALRTCPYRFFSRVLLGLGEVDELDAAADKRDHGNWLHAVLLRFHLGRECTTDMALDTARLMEAAAAVDEDLGWTEAELLPFRASFEALVPGYLRWLHLREVQGWRWWQGEISRQALPSEWGGLGLHGRLDRLDSQADGRVELLDYKTGSASGLASKVRQGLEDTQLAFYAALALASGDAAPGGLTAAYLTLDDPRAGPVAVPHENVDADARVLLQQLGLEFERLRDGEPLLALGQGDACEHCEARGLCRRDQWAPPPANERDGAP